MIPDIKELNFPKLDGKQYATLEQATASLADMGEKTVTAQVKIDGDIIPDFSFDWAVEFQGEKYIMPLRIPQGSKENDSFNSLFDLTFQHWAVYQLKRWPFVTIQQIAAGTYLPDKEVASESLNLKDFCILLGQQFEYYFGEAITIDLNPEWQYDPTPIFVEISHTKIWNVLIETLYDKYGVRWEIKPAAGNSNTVKGGERYVVRVGYPTTEVGHVFKYGFEGGLFKVERQVQSDEIRNMLNGRGGEKNIPFRYYKNTDPNNPNFAADPDWVEELKDIYFPNLMGATFRSYIQGWKAAHINKTDSEGEKIYVGYTPVGEANAYAPWAYRKGFTDAKFSPVEFVADEITLSPTTGDSQTTILPGYAPFIKAESSIAKYGPLPDTLDNNDDIYPTLQGTGMDIAVDVEQITSDEPTKESDATIHIVAGVSKLAYIDADARKVVTTDTVLFQVPAGKTANLIVDAGTPLTNTDKVEVESYSVEVYDSNNEKRSASGIPEGFYTYRLTLNVHNMTQSAVTAKFGASKARLMDAVLSAHPEGTFDIWIKNIWNSARLSDESDVQYSERVWKPVLGDREGNEAKVMFTTGNLVHEDYEFSIVEFPKPDTSKTWVEKDPDGNTVATHASHWKITLAKSDAELEATGLYIPNTKRQGKAGDRFVFIGTEMTHVPYVTDAEVCLDDWKKDQLGEKKEIKPTFVVTPDRVRIGNEGKPGALINQLCVGNSITLRDKRFIDGSQDVALYIQSVKYTYRKPTKDDAALNPDVELTLGNDYAVSSNPVSTMQGEINALQRQVGAISNIEQIVRAIGDKKYLRKTRSDRTPYDLAVGGELIAEGATRSKDFASGMTGYGWRASASGEIEAASLTLRKFLEVPELRFNRATVVCGTQWRAAGGGLIESVEITDTTHGTAYLKLEDGEIGAVAVGDLCMGVFHKTGDDANNATADSDDRKGNFAYAGFTTVYFRINSVSADLKSFTYELRPGHTEHPSEAMNFVGYGNDTDTGRQKCWYATRTYERYLSGVSGWEFTEANIMMQTGDLSGLTVGGESLSGYSAYLNNVFFSGTIRQVRDRITQYADNLMSGTLKFSEPWEALGNTELRQKYQDFMIARCDNTAEASGATEVMPMLRGTAPVETGKIYTLSFWAKGSGQMRVLMYTATSSLVNIIDIATTGKHGGTAIGRYPGFNLTDEWTRHYIVFRAATDSASVDKAVFFQAMSNTDASLIAVKLEEGDNRQPAWTPSAEDMLGKKGDVGPAGAVMRIRGLFDASAAYADGTTADADGIRWVDVVWVESATGTRYYYTCANSAGAALNAPTASADGGNANWSPMSDLGNVYADMIFARNAHIDFLSGQEIVFGETQSDGTTKVHGRIGVPKSMYVMYDPISLTSDEADTETNVDSGVSPQSAAARIGTSTSTGTGTGAVTPGGDISIPIVTNGYAIDGIIMWLGGASADVATMTMQKTGLTTFGQYNKGRRIEVDPSNKEIRVFNDSGKLSVLIDGDTHTVDDLFKVDKHLVSDVGLPFSSSTPDDSPYSLGYFKTESNGHVKITCTVTISAQSIFIPATLGSPSNPSTGFSRILRGSAGVKLVLLKSNGKEQLSSSVFYEEPTNYLNNPPTTVTRTNSNKTMNLSIEGDIPADTGEYRAQLIVTINKPTDTESGETATASTIVRIKKGDADFTPVADPRAMLCANGLIVANSPQNYLTAGVHGSEGFIIEGRVGNNGIKINSEGIWALNAMGQPKKIKLTLM